MPTLNWWDVLKFVISSGILGGLWAWYKTTKKTAVARLALLTSVSEAVNAIQPTLDELKTKLERHEVIAETVGTLEPSLRELREAMTKDGGLDALREVVTEIRDEHAVERAARRVISPTAYFESTVRNDGTARVLFVSPEFVRLTGLTREDCEYDGWIRCVQMADRDRVSQISRTALEEASVMSTTYRLQHVHTRKTQLVEHTGTPVLSFRGTVVGWIGIITPVASEAA